MDPILLAVPRYGVTVTARFLRTRLKDQALAPITAVRIGRDPLWLALASGLGLAMFGFQFGDLLYPGERAALMMIGVLLLAGGYAVASLHLGTPHVERTMLWADIWTIRKVRDALAEARATGERPAGGVMEMEDEAKEG
ncbi:hypothetical protein [Jiella mangrovi]|uniref:Uncharacterized protein n=1 Tax=Jiella mangrovi TaxID=2821407 RepID=A0ABS4BCI4_9HYPH|nr:hypothetical protein [Jiella mangrovi]MBP0614242.1 hypothetical protein [Jiella mangrovi]